MNTLTNKPKRSKVLASPQPKTTQESVLQKITTPQVPAPLQVHDIPRSKPVPTAKPTLEDIAKRAYEIYVKNGCQPGQCEENWIQAEQELKKGLKVVSA